MIVNHNVYSIYLYNTCSVTNISEAKCGRVGGSAAKGMVKNIMSR